MTDLRIGDDIFNVTVEGDATKPPLMLSHSLGIDLSMWDAQMPALLEHFRVVRYDTRGHGGSATTAASISIERLGRDALAILDALEIDRVHWIGLSMGGVIGQWLLLNAPDRVDRAVLANTAAKLGTPDGWNQRIVGMLAGATDAAADATMERWFSAGFMHGAPDRAAAIDAVLRNADVGGYVACCAALRDVDLRQELLSRSTIAEAPVLLITGADDPVISNADTAFLRQAFASAHHVVLDARHISNIEAEAAFTAAVVEFLTAKPARRKAAPRARLTTPAPTIRRPAKSRSTAARVPLKSAAKPVVHTSASAGSKPTATRGRTSVRPATKAGGPKTAALKMTKTAVTTPTGTKARRKGAPAAKEARAARGAAAKPTRAPSRTAVAAKTTRPPAKPAAKAGAAKPRTTAKPRTAAATQIATRRKPPAAAARGAVTKPARMAVRSKTTTKATKTKPPTSGAANPKTMSTKTAKAKTTAAKRVRTKPVSAGPNARKTAARNPPVAKKGAAKTPIAAKAKAASKTAPVAKAPAARRKTVAAKSGRPTGRRKP